MVRLPRAIAAWPYPPAQAWLMEGVGGGAQAIDPEWVDAMRLLLLKSERGRGSPRNSKGGSPDAKQARTSD